MMQIHSLKSCGYGTSTANPQLLWLFCMYDVTIITPPHTHMHCIIHKEWAEAPNFWVKIRVWRSHSLTSQPKLFSLCSINILTFLSTFLSPTFLNFEPPHSTTGLKWTIIEQWEQVRSNVCLLFECSTLFNATSWKAWYNTSPLSLQTETHFQQN